MFESTMSYVRLLNLLSLIVLIITLLRLEEKINQLSALEAHFKLLIEVCEVKAFGEVVNK